MKVLLTGAFNYTNEQLNMINKLGYSIIYVENELQTIEVDVQNIEVVVCNALFLYNKIENIKKLKFIQTTSVGLNRLPLDYIRRNSIKVFNAGNTYSIPIAEFAIMGILNIYKHNDFFLKNKFNKIWEKNRNLLELTDKNVLIMGYGNIGMEIAKRLIPFNVNIYAYDINEVRNENVIYENDYNKILHKMDIIILTLPLTSETFHLINESFISKLKDNITLVNVSRGALIDEKALIYGLENNKFLSVALDVFEEEPLTSDSILWDYSNV